MWMREIKKALALEESTERKIAARKTGEAG